MKILLTGLSGTVAPAVATYFKMKKHTVIPFDRDLIHIDNHKEVEDFISKVKPDVITHFGTSSITFTTLLSSLSQKYTIKFLFISSVMVFEGNPLGPYHIHDIPLAKNEYGMYKYQSELEILNVNKDSYIVRLGWQIGITTYGNQMITHLKKEYLEKGYNEASNQVFLACSFITETARLIDEILKMKPGLYHIDQSQGMSYYDVINYLKEIHPWITPKLVERKPFNNQLLDDKLSVSKFKS